MRDEVTTLAHISHTGLIDESLTTLATGTRWIFIFTYNYWTSAHTHTKTQTQSIQHYADYENMLQEGTTRLNSTREVRKLEKSCSSASLRNLLSE